MIRTISALPADLRPHVVAVGDCWIWTGPVDDKGYAYVGRHSRVHRIVATIVHGEIPRGRVVDHWICHNKRCVRPEHLRIVTSKQNNENRAGAQRNSKSGVRGVYWSPQRKKWHVTAGHAGKVYYGGQFDSLAEATRAAAALRTRLHSHNVLDRIGADCGPIPEKVKA